MPYSTYYDKQKSPAVFSYILSFVCTKLSSPLYLEVVPFAFLLFIIDSVYNFTLTHPYVI